MVAVDTLLRLLGGLVLLGANAFFVASEFALTRVRQFPADEFDGDGLDRAWEMTERLEIYLSGCQVGITVSSVGLGVVAEPATAALLDPAVRALGLAPVGAAGHTAASVVAALAVINLLHVVLGEQVPTYLGVERTKTVARYFAPLLYWWTMLAYPVIVVADRTAKGLLSLAGVEMTRAWTEAEAEGDDAPVSRADLRREMGESLARIGVPAERRREVINALDIGEKPVSEVMVDREEVVALSTERSLEGNLDRMREFPHVRFPLVGEDLEDYRGNVYTPALLRHLEELRDGDLDLASVAAPPMTATADEPVSDLIDRFQAESQELALVLDEGEGEVVGLVTATDAFEAIAGQLEDPLDHLTPAA